MRTFPFRFLKVAAVLAALAISGQACPAQILNQLIKKKNSETSTTTASKTRGKASGPVTFNAEDPFAKENQRVDGTPWAPVRGTPVEVSGEVPAVIPKPLPSVETISAADYRLAVSVAFETLRIIYGEQTEEDAEQFKKMWAPIFDFPFQEMIDYLNKLNPLLSQFLVARETYLRSFANFQESAFDASEAIGLEDEAAYNEAMEEASLYASTMQSMQAAMDELTNRIIALGNPPNPLEARARARKRYNSVFEPKEVYLGESWMGTKIDSRYEVPGLELLTEPLFRYLFKAKVNGEDRFFVIQLSESGPPAEDDEEAINNIRIEQFDYNVRGDERPDFTSDGQFRTYYPKPPVLAITTLTMNLMRLFEMSYPTDEDEKNGTAALKEAYHNAAGNYGNRVLKAGFFFKVGYEWSAKDQWNKYSYNDSGVIPGEAMDAFTNDLRKALRQEIASREKSARQRRAEAAAAAQEDLSDPAVIRRKQIQDSLAFEEKSRRESIECHEEIARSIQQNLDREISKRASAKGAELEDIDRRIMYFKSDLQNERDIIQSLETGEFVHTRTAFDDYAFNKVIQEAHIEAERYDRTKRAAGIVSKQISRLPKNEQRDARERLEKILYEDGALGNGDIEKVRALGSALNNRFTGEALKEQAEAIDREAWINLGEAGTRAAIMGLGSVTMGIAAEAFAATYGAGSALAIWGPRVIGALYGGATGYVADGPSGVLPSAAGLFHPVTAGVASFVKGFNAEGSENLSIQDRTWNGVVQTGQDLFVQGLISVGGGIVSKGLTAICPSVKMNLTAGLAPGLKARAPTTQQKLDMLRTKRQQLEAQDAVKGFEQKVKDLAKLKETPGTPEATIKDAETDLNQLVASLNSDYHAKWQIKYKASREVRTQFNDRVQQNYDRMTPEMVKILENKGYVMDDIEFKQFRNSSSSGSSSMDLDLAPTSKSAYAQDKTIKEPAFLMKTGEGKDPIKVPAEQFMADAQKAMNDVYFKQNTISAKASEMNLTTSAHPEAYSNPVLLQKNVDYLNLPAKDIASIGKVIDVKMNTIEANNNMTALTKMQAKCREANKEISNMLLPMLKQRQRVLNANPNTKAEDIIRTEEHLLTWESIQRSMEKMGTKTNDPMEIYKISEQIRKETGGKDVFRVINDLIREFNPSFEVQ